MHRSQETKVLVNLGNSFFSQGKYNDAISNYRAATELSLSNCQAFFNWGNALRRQENFDEAILNTLWTEHINIDVLKNPTFWARTLNFRFETRHLQSLFWDNEILQAYNNWGLCLNDLEKYLEAAYKFEKAIEINPKFSEAYNNWGIALTAHYEYTLAIAKYKKAIEINPNYAEAYYNLGNALCSQSKYDEAIKNFARATEIQPNHAKAHHNWGVALAAQENHEEAIKKYKKTVEISPDYSEAYNNWALVLYKEKRYHEAVQVFVKGCKFIGLDSLKKHELIHFFEHQLKEDEKAYSLLNNELTRDELKAKIDGIHTILKALKTEVTHHLQPPQEINIPGRNSPISPLEISRNSPSEDSQSDFRVNEYQKLLSEELLGLFKRVMTFRDGRVQEEADKLLSLLTFAATFIPPLYNCSYDERIFPVLSKIAPDGILMEDVITIRRVNRCCQEYVKHIASLDEMKQIVDSIVNKMVALRKEEIIRDYTKAVNPRSFMKVRQAKIKDLTNTDQVMSKAQEFAFFDTVMVFVLIFLEGQRVQPYSNSTQKIENLSKTPVNTLQTLIDELKNEKKNLIDWCNSL